jgi:hypothetical protein
LLYFISWVALVHQRFDHSVRQDIFHRHSLPYSRSFSFFLCPVADASLPPSLLLLFAHHNQFSFPDSFLTGLLRPMLEGYCMRFFFVILRKYSEKINNRAKKKHIKPV